MAYRLYTKLTAVDMDKLNKYTEMENVKEILIEFKEYFNNLNDTFITESNINRFIMQSKYRPREPEAINRNEQAKEFCQCSDDAKLMFVCKDCGKEWLVDKRQNG